MPVQSHGPTDARIMIVGEAPGREEENVGIPFVGSSGKLLDTMLGDAGINRSECYVANVCQHRPPNNNVKAWFYNKTEARAKSIGNYCGRRPDPRIVEGIERLHVEIERVKPNVIIALGDTALWALTGQEGITKWRGSIMPCRWTFEWGTPKIIPTYHPAYIMRVWSARTIAINDLTRAKNNADSLEIKRTPTNFIVRPSLEQVLETLGALEKRMDAGEVLRLACDLETRGGHIACCGIAWSESDAICIPFMCIENPEGYWSTADDEIIVVRAIMAVLRHKYARIVGQNYLYDEQYMHKHWFGARSNVYMDTMIAQHCCFPLLPKALDFQSSLYCDDHLYWKDEGKEWDSAMPEEQLWGYNCQDAVRTLRISYVHDRQIDSLNLRPQFEFQMTMYHLVLAAMIRGVRVNKKLRGELGMSLMEAASRYEEWFNLVVDETIHTPPKSKTAKPWYRSPTQQSKLFYEELGQKKVVKPDTGRPTCDDDALKKIGQREPLLRPLCERLAEYRSIGVLYSNCIEAELDEDDRMRCSYNVAGTATFRFSSSKNAFGRGMNLQNVTSGDESAELGWEYAIPMPNLRKLLVPDPGYVMIASDLDRADLQIVVWEADDKELKQMLREGANIHLENARTIFGGNPDVSKAANSPYHKAKQGVHATNYGCGSRTLARHLGITVHEAEQFINRWLDAHPGIRKWHERVQRSLDETRSVRNAFGFRQRFFDRPEAIFTEALAWIPQSTVALIINHGWKQLGHNVPWAEVLMQVHDELVFQIPMSRWNERAVCGKHLLVQVPYDDPLTIPVGCSASSKSWGDCKEYDWDDGAQLPLI